MQKNAAGMQHAAEQHGDGVLKMEKRKDVKKKVKSVTFLVRVSYI